MEVTVWIERSLGLSLTKQVPSGSTIATLKQELLAEDLLGSIAAKDLRLVQSNCNGPVLADDVLLTDNLSDLEIGTAFDIEEGPEQEPTGCTGQAMEAIQEAQLEQEPTSRTKHRAEAPQEVVGNAASPWTFPGFCITGKYRVGPPDSTESGVTYVFFHEPGSGSFVGYQENWVGLHGHLEGNRIFWKIDQYECAGLMEDGGFRIENIVVKNGEGYQMGIYKGTKLKDDPERSSEPPPSKDERQQELERKAELNKDNVRRTAAGAKKLLGVPLQYDVVNDCPIYLEPMPHAKLLPGLRKGDKVFGYPGSVAWVRIDGSKTTLPKEAVLEREKWLPVRSQDSSKDSNNRELVLHAIWPELHAVRIGATSMDLTWPGVPQPVDPHTAEYTVEVRPKGQDLPAGAATPTAAVTGITKTKATVRGLVADVDVQLRVCVKIVGPYSTDFRLFGPWRDYRTATQEEEEAQRQALDSEAAAATESAETEIEGTYEVVHDLVMLRGEPTRQGRPVGVVRRGQYIFGVAFKIEGIPWIKLPPQRIPPGEPQAVEREIQAAESVWAMIDASGVRGLNLGLLLRRAGDGRSDKMGEWKVLHDRVLLRNRPTTQGEPIGFQKKGSKVLGVRVCIEGVEWLRVEMPGLPGAAVSDLWMLIDGKALGFGQLLERVRDAPPTPESRRRAAAPKATASRPLPPNPLTASWLAAHGGLPVPPKSAMEEKLDADVDVGMASQCSLVIVEPTGGGPKKSYVAKRAAAHGDSGPCMREYSFYVDIAMQGSAQRASPPETIGDEAMRIPRCWCANLGKQGQERDGFLLLMERLDPPEWVHVDPEIGCSYEQAVAAVETLGRLHKAFPHARVEKECGWLPATLFDVRNADQIQLYFSYTRPAAQPLVEMLPPGAQEAVDRMSSGGLGDVFVHLAEPPLTLCHGDYRPENMRFTAPGKPLGVGVFDWGLVNRARGIADFAYFVMLSQPPRERRAREQELLKKYLDARGDWSEKAMEQNFIDLKSASIAILGMILMTRHGIAKGPHGPGTRNMLVRMMRWVGEAITDWRSMDVLPSDDERP